MVRLSVNVNKVATLRNSRGGAVPSVIDAVRVVLEAGAPGVTVHPRADERHITRRDVLDIAALLADWRHSGSKPELNIEGDPRPDLMALVHDVRPDQCTLVPVLPSEVTSQGRWPPEQAGPELRRTIAGLRDSGIRVSVFIDPDVDLVRWAADIGADRVELFTEPFARAFARGRDDAAAGAFEACVRAAEAAHELGLGLNAGHDLDHENLAMFRALPHLDEVSIGHALISRALFNGLDATVREYLAVLR